MFVVKIKIVIVIRLTAAAVSFILPASRYMKALYSGLKPRIHHCIVISSSALCLSDIRNGESNGQPRVVQNSLRHCVILDKCLLRCLIYSIKKNLVSVQFNTRLTHISGMYALIELFLLNQYKIFHL